MLKNYLKLAFRNIARKKIYSVVNLAGLGIASAFCILVYWYIQAETSFDQFHKNISRLYRIELSNLSQSANEKGAKKNGLFSFITDEIGPNNVIVTPPVMGIALQQDFPEIEHSIRLQVSFEKKIRINNQSFIESKNVAYVDKDFFSTFSFPLLRGNPSTVLEGRNNIVLSEKIAEKYFGKADAIGKTIMFPGDDSSLFVVTGIAKNFPSNSSFHYDLLMPRTSAPYYDDDIKEGLNTYKDLLFIQLKEGVNRKLLQQRLDKFAKFFFAISSNQPGNDQTSNAFKIYMRPFEEAHYIENSGWGHYTSIKNIFELISITVILLIIACLNYILLTLAETVSRSQEIGIRKTIGAERKQIIFQFYIETQLLCFIGVFIGFALAITSLPFFSELLNTQLGLTLFSLRNFALIFLLAVALGVLSGVYPALVMSGLNPLNMMRKHSAYRFNPLLSKLLTVIQFSVCVILIITTLVINKQMHFINQKDLGFDKEQIITVRNPYDDLQTSYRLKNKLAHFASLEPAIENFTSSFLGYFNVNSHLIHNEKVPIEVFDVDYNYFSFFQIPIVKGRDFLQGSVEDSAAIKLADGQYMKGASSAKQVIIVNETLFNMLGKPKLNEINPEIGGRIIGVCKDYYPDELTKKIAPAYHRIARTYIGYFSFKIKANQNVPQEVNKIKNAWDQLSENEPFSFTFLDETIAKNYDTYLRWMKTITTSSILSIFIACMGLFGLSALTASGRIKEIGIRKVFGASPGRLFLLLNKASLMTAIISFVIAIPFAIYLSNAWLQNFAYRIKLSWPLFALSEIICIITATIAVSYHTLKAVRANPVKSLRPE